MKGELFEEIFFRKFFSPKGVLEERALKGFIPLKQALTSRYPYVDFDEAIDILKVAIPLKQALTSIFDEPNEELNEIADIVAIPLKQALTSI